MKKIIITSIIVFLSVNIFAQSDSLISIFNNANKNYKNGNYQKAIKNYKHILANNYHSAEIYFNLGNAYFKNMNIPKAILNYERALKLAPADEDIKHNIEFANLYVKDEFSDVPVFIIDKIYLKIAHSASSNTWAVISIVLFIFALSSFLFFLFSKYITRRKLTFFFSVIFIAFSVISFIFSGQTKKYFTNPHTAIVMEINTIKSSPQEDGTDLFILNPGVKVKIENQNEQWYQVVLPNGTKGWLKKEYIEKI